MLANIGNISENIPIFIKVGVGTHQRFINVTQLHKTLRTKFSAALLVFHAFTGCNFNPVFFRQSKKHPCSIMSSFANFTDDVTKVGLYSPTHNTLRSWHNCQLACCEFYKSVLTRGY